MTNAPASVYVTTAWIDILTNVYEIEERDNSLRRSQLLKKREEIKALPCFSHFELTDASMISLNRIANRYLRMT